MSWQPYNLDRIAQTLVLKYRHRDVLNESHKMRMAVAYGLERFWGEHLRLNGETEGEYWKDVWDALANEILIPANIVLPNDLATLENARNGESTTERRDREFRNTEKRNNNALSIFENACIGETSPQRKEREASNTEKIKNMADRLWEFGTYSPYEQRVALSILTQLCDCLVWWTQRYKPSKQIIEN